MPMPTLKGNESRTTNTYNLIHAEKKRGCQIRAEQGELTGDGFGTSCTTFGKEFSKTLCAIRFVISGSKALSSQGFGAMSASETFAMPRIIAVGYTTLCNNL